MIASDVLLAHAARLLDTVGCRFVFVGGVTVHLHVDDPGASPVRTTNDVDIVVAVSDWADYAAFEDEFRRAGFEHVISDDAPLCRWTRDGVFIDVIPTKPELIGFSESRWFESGFDSAVRREVDEGHVVEVFDVVHLLAVKIEAFEDRGHGDLFGSADFEDIATILDGHLAIWDELSSDSEVAEFVRGFLAALEPDQVEDALAGHVGGSARARLIVRKLGELCQTP